MKKGLILALMVGLGIMAGPVMAEAPVLTEMPKVIIGSAEDVTTPGGNTVLRYINAIDIGAVVDWGNDSFTSQSYRLYWSSATDLSGIDVRISGTSSFTPELSAAELVAMTDVTTTSFGTPPATAAEILGNGAGNWLSLMNLDATTTNVGTGVRYPPHAYLDAAMIDAWGVTNAAASVAGAVNDLASTPTELTLIAAVTSGTTQILPGDPGFLEVHSIFGANDATTDTLAYYEFPVQSVDGVSGWFWKVTGDDGTWITQATKSAEPTVGYDIALSDDPDTLGRTYFGEWQLADGGTQATVFYPADANGMGGKLFNTRLRLSNTGPSAELCPSYRILYANIAFTHIGGIQVLTTHDLGAPFSGNDLTVQLFWEVPSQATESADGGNLSTWPFASSSDSEHPDKTLPAYEWRDYTILFNSFHGPGQGGDFGTLVIEEVAIEVIDAPTAAASTVSYSNLSSWQHFGLSGAFPTLFADGNATPSAASITIQAGTDSSLSFRFYQTNPIEAAAIGGNLADHMGLVDNQLVRFSYQAQSVNVGTTPIVRVFLHAQSSDLADLQAFRANLNLNWEDEYGAALDFVKPTLYNITTVVPGFTNPGVAPATATTFSTWIYTHSGWQTGNYILPDFSVFSSNKYATGSTTHGWSDNGGGVVLSNIQVEAFDNW